MIAAAVPKAAVAKKPKSMVNEAKKVALAVELIQLGARLQLLEQETPMSYEKLLILYKEVAGKSPSKGQLPFSIDYFMSWRENIHSSLFANIYTYLTKASDLDNAQALIKSYRLYLMQVRTCGMDPELSITRAWRLVKFMDNDMIHMMPCTKCRGNFITYPYEIAKHHVCGLCNPPGRAGKTS